MNIDQNYPSKVPHPYLENKKVGIFSTRLYISYNIIIYSPIRPNPIGLSIVKLNDIRYGLDNEIIFFDISNVDMINNTPIIGIIPYNSSFFPTETFSKLYKISIIIILYK